MNKIITFSIGSILTLAFAFNAVAVSPSGQGQGQMAPDERKSAAQEKKADIQDKKEENQEKRLEQAKERATKAIDRRTSSLEALKTRMTERTRIREEERAMINNLIDDSIAQLKTEREQVENAGDLETLRNQFKNSIDKTHVFAIVVPQVRAYALTSAAYNGIDRIEKVFSKIEEVIANLEGDDKTEAEDLYSKAKTEVASAQSNVDKAFAEFKKMDPTDDPTEAHASLEAGKTYLKQAREELKNTLQYLKQIRTMLQEQTRLQTQEGSGADDETDKTPTTESITE